MYWPPLLNSHQFAIFTMRCSLVYFSLLIPFLSCEPLWAEHDLVKQSLETGQLSEKKISACQDCILNSAGAIRSHVTRQMPNVRFLVTASFFAFTNVHSKCSDKSICGELTSAQFFGSLIIPTESQAAANELTLPEKLNPACVLLNPHSVDANCELCLKESSGSRILGEFLFSSSLHPLKSLIILYPSTKGNFGQICSINGACAVSDHKVLPTDECQTLIREPSVAQVAQPAPTGIELAIDLDMKQKHATESIRDTDGATRCLDVRPRPGGTIYECIDSIIKLTNGKVFWLKTFTDYQHVYLFMSNTLEYGEMLDVATTECAEIKDTTFLPKCRILYRRHYESASIFHQISVWKPDLVIENLPNVISTNPRRCVLAHHEALTDACHTCVLQLDKAAVTTKELTTSSFLISLDGDFQELRLASCIIDSLLDEEIRCRRFEFLPQAMCSYEALGTVPGENDTGHSQSIQLMSGGSEQEKRKSPSRKRPYSTISEVLSFAKSKKFASIRAMISAEKQRQFNEAIAPISSRKTSIDIPIEAKLSTQSLSEAKMMVATWTGGDLKCLEHLTLYYDVLLISLERKYVWMHHVNELHHVVEFCGKLTIAKIAILDVRTLRAIPVVQVLELVDENGDLLWAKRSLRSRLTE